MTGHVPEGQELDERTRRDPGRARQHAEDGLRLGREEEPIAILAVIQRLLADAIARQHQPTPRRIPDGNGKHPAHLLESSLAEFRVERGNHLGVGRGREPAATAPQLVAQLHVVVDLAVLHHGDAAAVDGNRLVPACGIDDAQARGRQRRRAAGRRAGIVRTAMTQRRDHLERVRRINRRAAERDVPGNPTHQDRTRTRCSNRYGRPTRPSPASTG